jgi:WD40 repeat protein
MKNVVSSVAITPDASWILSGAGDRSVRIWDADTGALQCIIVGHENGGELFVISMQSTVY